LPLAVVHKIGEGLKNGLAPSLGVLVLWPDCKERSGVQDCMEYPGSITGCPVWNGISNRPCTIFLLDGATNIIIIACGVEIHKAINARLVNWRCGRNATSDDLNRMI